MISPEAHHPKCFKSQNPNFVGAKMRFNLLELHDSEEDTDVRKLLRVYSVIPRFAVKQTPEQAEQAVKVNRFLREVNERLRKQIGLSWKKKWMESMDCNFAGQSYKDWLIGRASPPLIALKKLEIFGLGEEVRELVENCNFFCSTTGRVFRIPHEMSTDLAYLLGVILGDGHIRKKGDTICLEVTEKWLTEKFIQKIYGVFEHRLNLLLHLKKERWYYAANSNNKPAVRMFNKFLEVPRGKKSHIIFVPEIIKDSNKEIRLAFLEGVFDTEGCIRKKGLRVTSASKQFRDDLCELLFSLGEKGWKDEWINKKYNKKYYGLQYTIGNIDFLQGYGSRQTGGA